MASHPCAMPGCQRLIGLDLLMCSSHWRSVPRSLQAEVYRTWRQRRRFPGDETRVREHDAAIAKAVAGAEKAIQRRVDQSRSGGDV